MQTISNYLFGPTIASQLQRMKELEEMLSASKGGNVRGITEDHRFEMADELHSIRKAVAAYPNTFEGRKLQRANAPTAVRHSIVNASTRKVGGIRFVKLGRFCVSFCVTKTYKAI